MRRTGFPPPLLKTAYHIIMSSTGARPLSSASGSGAGSGRVFHGSVWGVTEGNAPIKTRITAAVATISTIHPRKGDVVLAAGAMANLSPLQPPRPFAPTERVRKCCPSAAHVFALLYADCGAGGAPDERSRRRSARFSPHCRSCSDHNECDRCARGECAESGSQLVGYGSAQAEGAGERLRLPHAYLRPDALSDAAESK